MEKSAKALVIRALSDSLASLANVFKGPRIFARMTRRLGEHAPRCHEAVELAVDGFLDVDGVGMSDGARVSIVRFILRNLTIKE